jgi:hypothetical protein
MRASRPPRAGEPRWEPIEAYQCVTWFFRHYRHSAQCERPLRVGETMRRYLVALTIGVFIACMAAGGATAKDLSLPRCEWVKADNSASGVRVAQLEICCVASKHCPDDTFACAYACGDMINSCINKLNNRGFMHPAFNGPTESSCVAWILATPWCTRPDC